MSTVKRTQVVAIADAADESAAIDLRESESALVLFPAAFTGTHCTFKVSTSLTGTYYPVKDELGANEDIKLVTSSWVPIPSNVMTGGFVKVVAASTQGDARTLTVLSMSTNPRNS